MAGNVSPFAPASFPELPALDGIRLATAEAGIRYKGRTDLLLVRFDPAASVAGVFTHVALRLRAGRVGPRSSSPAGRRGRSSSIPATPTPSPA